MEKLFLKVKILCLLIHSILQEIRTNVKFSQLIEKDNSLAIFLRMKIQIKAQIIVRIYNKSYIKPLMKKILI
jgi:hypothetical protein